MSPTEPPDIHFADGTPGREEYADLFETTGWNERYAATAEELERAVDASWTHVIARDGSRLVGSGRVLADGVLYAYLCDLVVAPDYRGRGIGSAILRRLLERCDDAGIRDVVLVAAPGSRTLYERFGFAARPDFAPGMVRSLNRGTPSTPPPEAPSG